MFKKYPYHDRRAYKRSHGIERYHRIGRKHTHQITAQSHSSSRKQSAGHQHTVAVGAEYHTRYVGHREPYESHRSAIGRNHSREYARGKQQPAYNRRF